MENEKYSNYPLSISAILGLLLFLKYSDLLYGRKRK